MIHTTLNFELSPTQNKNVLIFYLPNKYFHIFLILNNIYEKLTSNAYKNKIKLW